MGAWEDLIKTLPSDEDLERMEKDGTLAEVDRKLALMQEQINRMKEKSAKEDKELEEMLKNTETSIEESTFTK